MPRLSPYLQRRGDMLFFRIATPSDLRPLIGVREITKTLRTAQKIQAIPMALEYAAIVKRIFIEVRAGMAEQDEQKLIPLLKDWKQKFKLDELRDQHQDELHERDRQHREELGRAKLEVEAETMRRVLAGFQALPAATPLSVSESPSALAERGSVLMLSAVIDDFMMSWPKGKMEMLKKHQTVLPMFLEIVGDKPVASIRQSDLNDFFRLIQRLPPRWKDMCGRLKISIPQLAAIDHPKMMAAATFEDSYKASMRLFLKAAVRDWQDEGFPTTLTTEALNYQGDRKKGESKQRALTSDELKRLFEGPELRAFAEESKVVHQFWLPVLGLFTGARVNELCQINPQSDIFRDEATDVWCMLLTEETEAGEGVNKSIKTSEARAVPLHQQLVEIGFLDYVEAIKKAGSKQLFPAWEPRDGRAGANAMKWFSRFLADIDLHGVENEKGRALRGMHAFRHTLLTYGKLAGVNLRCISGHAERSDNPVADGYEDDTLLTTLIDKRDRLNKLDYGLTLPKPVSPESVIKPR